MENAGEKTIWLKAEQANTWTLSKDYVVNFPQINSQILKQNLKY